MKRFRYTIADVFTATPLQGNQLAVFTDARGIPEQLLQPLAKELGFSETVFVYPPKADGHVFIRIFTPDVELPFAGHPILGTAFVLGVALQAVEVRLETGVGIVPVVLDRDGARVIFGWMRQPIPTISPFTAEAETLAALGIKGSELPVEVYNNGIGHVFFALGSEAEVAALRPDLGRLAAHEATRIVGVNCFAGSGSKWKLRMFVPGKGVPEDAATGSAAGPLALHLSRHGRIAFGQEIEISQGIEIGRPSLLYARAEGSADAVQAIQVGGSAVIVARGEFLL